ncbi:hypothetical protein V8F20_001857 [Naviculisporaceae sp. PSN 640]
MFAPNHRAERRFLERQREMRQDLGTLSSGPAPFRSRNPRIYKWPNTPQILEWAAGATSTTRITNLSTDRLSRLGRGGLTPLFHPGVRGASLASGYAMDMEDENDNASMSTRNPLSQRSRGSLSTRAARGLRASLWPQVEDEIKRLQADFEHDLRVTRIHFSNHYDFMELGLYNLSKQVGGLQRVLEQNLERAERADPRELGGGRGIGVRKRPGDRAFDWPEETEMGRKRRELSPEDAASDTETLRSMSEGSDAPAPRRGGIGEEQGDLSKVEAMNRLIRRASDKLRQKGEREIRKAEVHAKDAIGRFLSTGNGKELDTSTPSRSPSPEVSMPGGYPKSVSTVAVESEKAPSALSSSSSARRKNPFRGDEEDDSPGLSGPRAAETGNNVPHINVLPPSPPKMTHHSMDYYKMHLEAAELRDEMHRGLEPEWYDSSVKYPELPQEEAHLDDERWMMSGGLRPITQESGQADGEIAASVVQPGPEPAHRYEEGAVAELPASALKPVPTAEPVGAGQAQPTSDQEQNEASRDQIKQHFESLRKLIRNFCHSKALNLGPCNKNLNSTSLGSREFPFASTFPTPRHPDLIESIPSSLPAIDPQAWNKYSKTVRGHIIMAGVHQILWDAILALDDDTIRAYYSSHWDVYSMKIINWIYYSLRPVWNQWVFLSHDNGDEEVDKIKALIMNFVEQAAWLRYSIVEKEIQADHPRYRPSFMLMIPDVETAMKMESEGVWEDFFIQKGEVEDVQVTFSDNSNGISGTSTWTEPNLITGNYDFTFVYPALMEGRLDITTGEVDDREVIGKGWVLYKTKTAAQNEEYESHTEPGEDDAAEEQLQEEPWQSRSQEPKGKGKEKAQPPGKKRKGRKDKSVSPSPSRGAEDIPDTQSQKSNLGQRRGHSPNPIISPDSRTTTSLNAKDGNLQPENHEKIGKEKKVSWADEVEQEDDAKNKAPKAKPKDKEKGKGRPTESKEEEKERKEKERKQREEALQKKKAQENYQSTKRDQRKDQNAKSNRPHAEVVAEEAVKAKKKKEKISKKLKERGTKGVVSVLHDLGG